MMSRWLPLVVVALCFLASSVTGLPYFVNELTNLPLSENTPVGSIVYTLQVHNDDALPLKFGLRYTDKFKVDPDSGEITLLKPLDRELEDTIKFEVYIEEEYHGSTILIQTQPVTVIVLDENDNPPLFKNSPYEVDVAEDEVVGTTLLRNIEVEDRDSFGDSLEVDCVSEQWPEACEIFEVVTLHSSSTHYKGALVLKKPLNYSEKQFYQFQLYANDGVSNSTAAVEVKVRDVQNMPPAFIGSFTAALPEDAPVGTYILTVKARDADRVNPRDVVLELDTNPLDLFVLDRHSGELKTARPLDREALPEPSLPLNITVRATEIVKGVPLISNTTTSTTTVTLTIVDINDESPRFSRREYAVSVPESLPVGTPIPNLDMVVTDTDMGLNSAFSLRLADSLGAFVVDPANGIGSVPVTLRLNKTLDYEDPNQRKFILEVIAEETHTLQRLSSRASVVVTLRDANDNAPELSAGPHEAAVSEDAPANTTVFTITATDRDTGRFGTEGIVYALSGNGAELFYVNPRTGQVVVAECPTPGSKPCLDYEEKKDYFLQYTATDDDGAGQWSVAPVHISLTDTNDHPPIFLAPLYKASIDENAVKFEPELQVQARDADASSEVRYSIVTPPKHPFTIDPLSGKIGLSADPDSYSLEIQGNRIALTVLASDGLHNATCTVEIAIRDVNDHAPQFDESKYDADIVEDAPVGTQVAAVRATDMDSGENAEIKYAIQKGAYDAFNIDNVTGVVTISSPLDYDSRNTYNIQIIASDMGMPSLTGTTELTVHVSNVNNKPPLLTPPTQRVQVSVAALPGDTVHTIAAHDPDADDKDKIVFALDTNRTIRAVTVDGQEVSDEGIFGSWFRLYPNGRVAVAAGARLDRARGAVISLPVVATDTSAPNVQRGYGEVIITIVEVNLHAPVFSWPWYREQLPEEQPPGTVLNTFTATDRDTPIAAYLITPPSPYFTIDNATGVVRTSQRIDYEKVHTLTFTLVALDSGSPQMSGSAMVTVEVLNVNDEEPIFAADRYDATVLEHAEPGTRVVTVTAVDKDDGEYGVVRYSLSGELAEMFYIDPSTGVVSVAPEADIDREQRTDIWLSATASDMAPPHLSKSNSVPIHIRVLDINDNPPVFSQKVYISTVAENLQLNPPAAILQVQAVDKDEGINGKVAYSIIEQSEPGVFTINSDTGIVYPAGGVAGNRTYELVVEARDGAGRGPHRDAAGVLLTVTPLNRHAPAFTKPPLHLRQIEIPEVSAHLSVPWVRLVWGRPALRRIPRTVTRKPFAFKRAVNAAQADYLITKFEATDLDSGENGRVSYYLKVDNQNVGETPEFSINRDTGELRTKTFLDREHKAEYPLVVVAADNGSPPHEQLRLLSVVLQDEDDNIPRFLKDQYSFTLRENLPPNVIVGTVKAEDKDAGENGQVYYHILEGNHDGAFTVSKTSGVIKANVSFDREQKSEYSFTLYASNSPLLDKSAAVLNSIDNGTEGRRDIAAVTVRILDENDNAPKFESNVYYAGVTYTARVNEPIISVAAADPDLEENGTLVYMVAASNLYKFGAEKSSGSVVPSPFNITQDGLVMTAGYMSEYAQDRFVLDIIAQEIAPPHRQAKAQVFIWIIDSSSLMRLVMSRGCPAPSRAVPPRLSHAARALLVPARAMPHVHADRAYDHWCEIHLHAVDPSTYQVLPVEKVLETIDSKYDELKDVYQENGVETLIALSATSKAPDAFDPALATLIALLIVLFTGIVTFIVVCACLKHWVIAPPSLQSSKGDSVGRRRILEELSTTENPLWLETKLRPYEEQELTMNVFGDQLDQLPEPAPTDNTYATIAGRRSAERSRSRLGDYDTLTLARDSPTPLEAALGFQGSTFKPPSRATPEPPPRPSAGLGHVWSVTYPIQWPLCVVY